ncbi:hypothetical protein GF354_00315 [Candidatus Peregrinibacteria bacterium]|nr:hypothetical protein [Candidatus Peregrinibacteria bacterium]
MKIKLIIPFILVLTAACTNIEPNQISKVCVNETCVNVELAQTEEERAEGLMFRENLPQDKGMLFIYESEQLSSFWMKNTLIPLDIIWIGEDMRIKNITSAAPCEVKNCPVYPSIHPAKYVLEVNKGFSQKHNLDQGDKVSFFIEDQAPANTQ